MNELYHHGVLGMHWGIRRWQNPDGTLTNAGRARFKKVNRSGSLKRKNRSKALKILKKQRSKETLKKKKAYLGYRLHGKKEGIVKDKLQSRYDKSTNKLMDLNTKISDIKNYNIKAGRDYIVATQSVKLPYIAITPLGGRFKLATIGKDYLIMK